MVSCGIDVARDRVKVRLSDVPEKPHLRKFELYSSHGLPFLNVMSFNGLFCVHPFFLCFIYKGIAYRFMDIIRRILSNKQEARNWKKSFLAIKGG